MSTHAANPNVGGESFDYAGGGGAPITYIPGVAYIVNPPATGGGGTVSDATASAKGVVQLAGDLGGTAAAPTVPGLAGKVPTSRLVAGHPLSADVTVTKTDVGLGNVDNTSDLAKPLSTATSTALGGKVDTTRQVAGHPLTADVALVKADVGLGNVDNTSDLAKPLSTATSTALGGKVDTTRLVAGHPLSADVTVTKADVGLGSVDNTSDATKAVASAAKLTTARTINGVSFDGTAAITVADSTKVPTTRQVNGKPLSADVSLAPADLAAGTINYAQLPVGGSFHITWDTASSTWKDLAGNTLAARPTARTDVRMMCETTATTPTAPSFAISGDQLLVLS